ncbi:MAG: hypothetical protein IAB19_08705 [Proteobacteria bacterium]|uniref:Uncharacterized protein n=1 Tax=Candidatus Avisuccinivibrio stercorigallinarum TaxID=2840704 RepID=A0A9D9DDJ2_9GAMM|nr:hypothetical protein [Candidatus Avisuccinivibrio stercorigallinarum]
MDVDISDFSLDESCNKELDEYFKTLQLAKSTSHVFKKALQNTDLFLNFAESRQNYRNIIINVRNTYNIKSILLCEFACLEIELMTIDKSNNQAIKVELDSINAGLTRIKDVLDSYGNIEDPNKYVNFLLEADISSKGSCEKNTGLPVDQKLRAIKSQISSLNNAQTAENFDEIK